MYICGVIGLFVSSPASPPALPRCRVERQGHPGGKATGGWKGAWHQVRRAPAHSSSFHSGSPPTCGSQQEAAFVPRVPYVRPWRGRSAGPAAVVWLFSPPPKQDNDCVTCVGIQGIRGVVNLYRHRAVAGSGDLAFRAASSVANGRGGLFYCPSFHSSRLPSRLRRGWAVLTSHSSSPGL